VHQVAGLGGVPDGVAGVARPLLGADGEPGPGTSGGRGKGRIHPSEHCQPVDQVVGEAVRRSMLQLCVLDSLSRASPHHWSLLSPPPASPFAVPLMVMTRPLLLPSILCNVLPWFDL
jgi:hypothetical protein